MSSTLGELKNKQIKKASTPSELKNIKIFIQVHLVYLFKIAKQKKGKKTGIELYRTP